MKTILFSLLALGINSAFAAPLVEEAICTGKIDGEEMKVISLVNPMNWCEEQGATESYTVLTSTTRGVMDVRMSYSYDDAPATLEMLDENDVLQKFELTCEFPQYHIECDEE